MSRFYTSPSPLDLPRPRIAALANYAKNSNKWLEMLCRITLANTHTHTHTRLYLSADPMPSGWPALALYRPGHRTTNPPRERTFTVCDVSAAFSEGIVRHV